MAEARKVYGPARSRSAVLLYGRKNSAIGLENSRVSPFKSDRPGSDGRAYFCLGKAATDSKNRNRPQA